MTYKRQKIKSIQQHHTTEMETIITDDDDDTIISDIEIYLDKEAINILNVYGSICVGGYMYSVVIEEF